jgi:hypothetical protein
MDRHQITALLLLLAGGLTVAAAIWLSKSLWPSSQSIAVALGAAGFGSAEIIGAGGALRAIRPVLLVGRWAAIIVGAMLIGLLVGAVVAGLKDGVLHLAAARLSLLFAFASLHFCAAFSAHKVAAV